MSDLAIMMSGHISVPLYPNLNSKTLKNILEHSETKLLFVGKLDNYEQMKDGVNEDIKCISYPFYTEDYPMWDDLVKEISPIEDDLVKRLKRASNNNIYIRNNWRT